MKIFQVIERSTNLALASNSTWYRNLYEPLIDLGHEVVLIPAEDGRRAMQTNDPKLRRRFSERIVEVFRLEHAKTPFDLAFFYLMEGMFEPSAIEEIRSFGVPVCNFSCNNIHQFYLVRNISKLFDWNLYSEKAAGEKFAVVGARALWWPMASNPKYFHPISTPRDMHVGFTGALYGRRLETVYQLLLNDIEVKVFGPGWADVCDWKSRFRIRLRLLKRLLKQLPQNTEQRARFTAEAASFALHRYVAQRFPTCLHGPVPDAEQIALYSRCQITLGFLEVLEHHDPIGRRLRHMHLRDFEAPMCGALYCTDYSDELAEMFEPGKEVIACHDEVDRVEKIRYYLAHEKEAERVREAGLKRTLACHTYHRRYRTLFQKVIGHE